MVEVFKTNVSDAGQANMLLEQIHKAYIGYRANFDLEDCDKVLRVQSATGEVRSACLIAFLHEFGICAEVLPDEVNMQVILAG